MITRLAFRNLSAARGRSIVTLLLSFASTALFIVYVAFMDGSHEQMIRSSVEIYTGYIHIDAKGYREKGGYDYLIEDSAAAKRIASENPSVSVIAERFETFALLSGDHKCVGAMVAGIEPSKEAAVSSLEKSLHTGRYLEDNDTDAIYIGSDLAKRLGVGVGSQVAMVGSGTDYSIAADLFTVAGIFKTGLFEFDSASSFVNKPYLDGVMGSENMASYLVLDYDHGRAVDEVVKPLNSALPEPLEAVSWKILLASLLQAMLLDSVFGYLSISIFFVVIFFVIMIFGYVNINARTKEIGVLRALGMSPKRIFGLLFSEALILGTLSVAAGTVAGAATAYYFELHPIVIPGIAETYKEWGVITDKIPMRFDPFTIAWNAVLVFVLNLLAVLYPIAKVNQLSPMEAIRHV
jgi:ABC-type lipoprotein release transport system permease subunit